MVSPATKLDVSESLRAVPDSAVAVVIGAGVAAWLKAAVPVTVLCQKASAACPAPADLGEVSGFRPPAAVSVPALAVLLAVVAGVVGRLAAYYIALVACAGTKLF